MVWFFTRDNEKLGLETRQDPATREFILEWRQPDGTKRVERFATEEAFRTYLEDLEEKLEAERWTRRDPPVLLREGWRM